jgi:hypothetical protein
MASSAVITSEFAPKRHRGRMIATVFYAQPIGQLVACLISVAVTAGYRQSISGAGNTPTNCDAECIRGLDSIWRWIVGCGAIPPAFAVLLRFWIPESPRWLFEVDRNPMGKYAARYHGTKFEEKDPLADEDGDVEIEEDANTNVAEHMFPPGNPELHHSSPSTHTEDGQVSPMDDNFKSEDSFPEPPGLRGDILGYGERTSVMSAAASRSTAVDQEDYIEVIGSGSQEVATHQ